MARSRRNEDRGGERRWTFDGVEYPTRKPVCAARREEGVRLPDEEGMNFTQAVHAVGVSKRAGKVWRDGRTRATGRNEKASMDWYRSAMGRPKRIYARHLNQEERIPIADRPRPGDSIRAIARPPGRGPGTVGREVERNGNPGTGDCEPCRTRQKAADRLKPPNRARRPTARRYGRGYRPDCAGIGARSGYPADRRRCSRIMVTCAQASKPSARPSACRPGAVSSRSRNAPWGRGEPPAGPKAAKAANPVSANPWS